MIELVLTNDWLSSSGHWHDPIHYECMQSHSVLMGIHCLICHLIIFIWNKSNFYILTESMIWIKHIENNFYAKWNVYMFWAHLCTKEDFIFTRMFFASLIEAIKFFILWHLFVAPVVYLCLCPFYQLFNKLFRKTYCVINTIAKNNPNARSSWGLKKREKTKTYYYDYCRTKIKAKYSNILKMCWSSAMLCLKCLAINIQTDINCCANTLLSAIGRKLMDPEGGAEISADTSADVGQSWTPTNASVIIVSLQRGSPIFHTRSITWFLCDQIITRSQKRLWTLAIYWLM